MHYQFSQIKPAIDACPDLMERLEDGFIRYSQGQAVIPPVGHLAFQNPAGDTHIKYGYLKGDDVFVVKIASGFEDNTPYGVSNGSGMVLVFSAKTGHPVAILADDGYLTALRTAAAGAICARHFAPKEVRAIGILGTGEQARLQLTMLRDVVACRTVYVYGRNGAKALAYKHRMEQEGYHVTVAATPREVARSCNLIITTTASQRALLYGEDILPGTHITAMGTDAPGKNEIDSSVFPKAALIIADSKSQCVDHGDISYAVKNGAISEDSIIELGTALGQHLGRTRDDDITIADLTGVAIQDIVIAKATVEMLRR